MSKLPKGWVELQLKDIAKKGGGAVSPKNYPDELFELYSVPSYSSGCPEIVAGADIGSAKQFVQEDDVLLCKIVPHIKRVWTVSAQNRHRQIASGEWIVYRDHQCDPNYLKHVLSETSFRRKFLGTVSGVGGSLMRANPKAVSEFFVPLPPLAEQKRIVAKLNALSARSARARKDLERIEALVARYKQAVLSKAFSGELTDAKTTRWRICALGDLIEDIRYGTAKKCDVTPELIPVLRIPNVAGGNIDLSELKYAEFSEKEIEKLALRVGDLLLIRSNGSLDLVGRSAVVPDLPATTLFAGYLIRLRFDLQRVHPYFVQYGLQEPGKRRTIEQLAKSTSGVNNINSEQIKRLEMPLPPLPEQREIVRRIESAFDKIDRLAGEAKRALALVGRLDEAVLAKAFRGELVPQDPNDEPASVLLERIRAERAAAPKPKRRLRRAP